VKRKIIQICPATGPASTQDEVALYALDNHGHIWLQRYCVKEHHWEWYIVTMPWEQKGMMRDGLDYEGADFYEDDLEGKLTLNLEY